MKNFSHIKQSQVYKASKNIQARPDSWSKDGNYGVFAYLLLNIDKNVEVSASWRNKFNSSNMPGAKIYLTNVTVPLLK